MPAWQYLAINLTPHPQLDAEKLAVKGNYKNGASARTILRAARKALFEKNPGEDEASSSVSTGEAAAPTDGTAAPASTPKTKTPTKRRKKGVAAAETDPNGNAEDEPATPKPKRQRKTPAKKVGASNPTPDIETRYGISITSSQHPSWNTR